MALRDHRDVDGLVALLELSKSDVKAVVVDQRDLERVIGLADHGEVENRVAPNRIHPVAAEVLVATVVHVELQSSWLQQGGDVRAQLSEPMPLQAFIPVKVEAMGLTSHEP